MPWLILRTLDVRIGTEGSGMRLYDGLLGNAASLSALLIIVLIAVVVAIYTDADTFGDIATSAVVIAVMTMVSSMMYYMDYQHDTVSAIEKDREDYLPESGDPEVHRLDDGIPGTPRRDRHQK